MSKSFFEISRLEHVYRPVGERVQDFDEVEAPLPQGEIAELSRRCQNCGIPFCHAMGCPLHNDVPAMIRAVVMGDWKGAWERLSETSSFPEFTSRVCPALCEASCCLEGTGYGATNIRQIEKRIIDTAFERDWVKPLVPVERRPESVAVIGAGPAGLAAAAKLNEAGYQVVVYDRQERPGGLLRYGIPCFKLDKALIDRRWQLLEAAGVQFRGQAAIGRDIAGEYLLRQHDAVIVACGTPVARNLSKVPGRDLGGIHLALEYLGGCADRRDALQSHLREGKAGAGDWRRRHGQRLRRHGIPPGCALGRLHRADAEAAVRARRLDALAHVALQAAHLVLH